MSDTKNNKDDYKVVIMHNFSYDEINAIMRAVRSVCSNRKELIFAKSTEKSLKIKLGELIDDMTEDHIYLMNNPPQTRQKK